MASQKTLYAGTFLIAASTLAFEILLTRILSVVTWYYLAFVAISIAMIGMTAGAVRVYMRTGDPLSEENMRGCLARNALATAAALALSVAVVCITFVPDVSRGITTMLVVSLLLLGFACGLPFYFSGVVITTVLTKTRLAVSRIYASDLIGAASAGVLVVVGFRVFDGPSLVLCAGALAAAAAMAYSLGVPSLRPLCIVSLMTAGALAFGALLNTSSTNNVLRPLFSKGRFDEVGPNTFIKWNTFSRVTINPRPKAPFLYWGRGSRVADSATSNAYAYLIDGSAATALYPWEMAPNLRNDVTNVGYQLNRPGRGCIIGVGGGRDVQSALYFGRSPVVGIDINPVFIELLQGSFQEIAGLKGRADVRLVVDEARSYLTRSRDRCAFLQMSLIDTWASTSAGALTLSENALYTLEAWRILFDKLTDNGIFSVTRYFDDATLSETGRLMGLAVATLLSAGITHLDQHVALIGAPPVATLLLSKAPFTPAETAKLRLVSDEIGFTPIILPGTPVANSMLARILAVRDTAALERLDPDSPLDMTPPTDDRPYFFDMLSLRYLFSGAELKPGVLAGNSVALIFLFVLITILLVAGVAVIVVPLAWRDRRANLGNPAFLAGAAYFSLIGAGFMFVELALMQELNIWASPDIPDTFDRWEDAIGGVKWNAGDSQRSSSARR